MGFFKNLKRALSMTDDYAQRQLVAFELSIEYKIENNIDLDLHEAKFIYGLKNELMAKLGITPQLYQQLRNELKDTWQHVLKRT